MAVKQNIMDTLGTKCGSDDPNILETYSKDESFVHHIRPRYVVKPRNTDEVQRIVKWANETQTPLVPMSSGPPHFRGDTVPSVGGAMIVDLSEMKRIIRVDRRNRVAMIEPGVTYGELIPALEKEGLAPFMPLSPRKTKSVVASCLEREPVTMPRYQWDMQDPLRCVEVIYGSGDLFRTGSAAGPGTIEEQWEVGRAQVRSMGPAHIDFAKLIQGAQGTMGIVTWATITCRLLPENKKVFFVTASDVKNLIDFTYKILWKKIGDECLILNNHNLSCLLATDHESIKRLSKALAYWTLIFTIEGYGIIPNERIAYQEAEFLETAQSFGLEPIEVLKSVRNEDILKTLSSPSEDPYWKSRYSGGCHDIFFLTIIDKVPEFIRKINELAFAYDYPITQIGVYVQPILQGTNCHCEFNLYYIPKDDKEKDKVRKFDIAATRLLASMGGFFSRPYGRWINIAYGNSTETVMADRKVKNIFDPNGIMNPGKLCF